VRVHRLEFGLLNESEIQELKTDEHPNNSNNVTTISGRPISIPGAARLPLARRAAKDVKELGKHVAGVVLKQRLPEPLPKRSWMDAAFIGPQRARFCPAKKIYMQH
jgi:hypothetical protein